MKAAAVMTGTERRAAIAEIAALPGRLDEAVKGLTDGQADTPSRPGGWTIRQIVHHLADAHIQGFVRMKYVLTEEHPLIKPYTQDAWASTADANAAPLEHSQQLLRGLHARWAALLESIPGEAWGRKGFHAERGDVTLDDLLRTYAAHCVSHVGAITTLRKERNW
jgi:uncharacterized damage-inducible protein DinB